MFCLIELDIVFNIKSPFPLRFDPVEAHPPDFSLQIPSEIPAKTTTQEPGCDSSRANRVWYPVTVRRVPGEEYLGPYHPAELADAAL